MSAQRAKTLHISAAFTRIKQYTCRKHVRQELPSAFYRAQLKKQDQMKQNVKQVINMSEYMC